MSIDTRKQFWFRIFLFRVANSATFFSIWPCIKTRQNTTPWLKKPLYAEQLDGEMEGSFASLWHQPIIHRKSSQRMRAETTRGTPIKILIIHISCFRAKKLASGRQPEPPVQPNNVTSEHCLASFMRQTNLKYLAT